MHPLKLPEDTRWRVMRSRKIRLNNTKTYYLAEVTFQKIDDKDDSLRKLASNQYKTVEMNISQIKYFPLGSIWENDTVVQGLDYFETFTIQKSCLFSKESRITYFDPGNPKNLTDYIPKKFQPTIETKGDKYHFPSSLCVYENTESFRVKTGNSEQLKFSFIAFPCYEIARFFLFSIGTYNDKLLRSDITLSEYNKLFDNDETWWTTNEDGHQLLHIKLKEGVPYRRYLNVSDLASSAKFRKQAMKLQAFLQNKDPFSGIELPIDRFKKMIFSAKRVQNQDGKWGLLVMAILSCTGYRNFDQVEVDHEKPSKKKSSDENVDDWEEEAVDRIQTINTGTPENYNDEDLTNNDLDPIITPVPPLMAAFAEDSEIVPYKKINEEETKPKTVNIIINEIEANEKALQTEESNKSGAVQPIQFDEGGGKTVYNPNAQRDESENSLIYPDRFFQDWEKIIGKIGEELKKNFGDKVSIRYSDENLNFDSTPGKFKLYKMMSGKRDPFLFRSVTKRPRFVYLIEFKTDNRYIYLLEPEFRSLTTTTTTLLFRKTFNLPVSKDELMRFFHIYIQACGVKIVMEKFDYIRTQFVLNATDHEVVKTQKKEVLNESGNKVKKTDNTKLTVREALGRHAEKLLLKIRK